MTARAVVSSSPMDDEAGHAELVEAAQRGDRVAFAELYARFWRMVYGIVLARVAHLDVDDLVQDVFLVAMERLGSLREPAAFGGWLAAIARTRSIDHVRRSPLTTELPSNLAAREPDRAEALAVLGVLRGLPDSYRETLTLRLVSGMTGREIAEKTGMTEGAVRVNLHRGMKVLRERLQWRRG